MWINLVHLLAAMETIEYTGSAGFPIPRTRCTIFK
jgi:hypothetical protein